MISMDKEELSRLENNNWYSSALGLKTPYIVTSNTQAQKLSKIPLSGTPHAIIE